jgi:hypothetical protein
MINSELQAFRPLLGHLKFIQKNNFYKPTKTIACTNPVVLSGL